MELIVTDAGGLDLASLTAYDLDLAYGSDENDFELSPGDGAPRLSAGSRVYMDGTPYGGVVDRVASRSSGGPSPVVYSGRTWSGILAGKIVVPPAGSDYYEWDGEANGLIRDLVERLGLQGLFTAPTSDSGISVSYRFERFCDAWSGLRAALLSSGAAPRFSARSGGVDVWAAACSHWGDEVDSDLVDFDIERDYRPVNHLVCAGSGELSERAVVHFYADEDGEVSGVQTLFGADERAALYDYSNADEDKLEEEGPKKLREYQTQGTVRVTVREGGPDMEVGDTVTGRDNRAGLTVTASVKKKIVKVSRGALSVNYEVDDATESGSVSSGSAESSGGGGHAYYAGAGLSLEGYTFSADVTEGDLEEVAQAASDAYSAASDAAAAAGGKVSSVAASAPLSAAADAGRNVALSIAPATASSAGSMSAADKEKLDGVEEGANAYVLPAASPTRLGGVKPDGTTVTADADGTLHAAPVSGASFLEAHPVGSYIMTSGLDPNSIGGTWSRAPSTGPHIWLREG